MGKLQSTRNILLAWIACGLSPLQAELSFTKTLIKDEIFSGKELYEFTFPFKNTGLAPVRIIRMESSCGCTVAKIKKDVITPGEEGEISGTFNPIGRMGLQKQSITVITDHPKQESILLALDILIAKTLSIKPYALIWTKDQLAETKTVQIQMQVKGTEGESLKIENRLDDFETSLVNLAPDQGKYELRVKPTANTKSQRTTVRLTLEKDGKEKKTFIIYLLIK